MCCTPEDDLDLISFSLQLSWGSVNSSPAQYTTGANNMEDLGVTIAGEPFPHMVYHFVLTYSNVEAASICFSETFEAPAEGIEKALWQIGGVPQQHRTDHLSAAVRHLRKPEREDWTVRYQGLMAH